MLKNYFKIAIRNLLKFKAYSFINIMGLAIGITGCTLILLYIRDELNYDKYNKKADQIYRVHTKGVLGNNILDIAVSPAPMAGALLRDFPEVVQATRFQPSQNMLIRYGDKVFIENRFLWADSTIFDVFTIPLIKGDPKKALTEPHTVVLTESTAKKYFGDEDPIGKILSFEDGTPYTVTGVAEDCPVNSHFHYDILASMCTLEYSRSEFWIRNNFYTYIVLKKGFPAEQFQAKMPEVVKKYAGPQFLSALGLSYDDLRKRGNSYEFFIQPLTGIHLNSHLQYEIEPTGDITYIYIFSVIAIFILLIACINFMNLSTARSATRAREVGIRKVLGSNKKQIIKQFIAESILLAFIASVISVALVELLLPYFNQLAGKQLETAYFSSWTAIPALLLTVIIVGFIAGSYPAFFLSSFKPIEVLKGKILSANQNSFLRSGLVVFQFAISIVLFIGTFVVYNQLMYVQNTKLGFNKDQVLIINRAWALEKEKETFENELKNNPGIIDAAGSGNIPGRTFGQTVFKPENAPEDHQYPLSIWQTDEDYASTMDLKMAEGRYFSKENPSDTTAVVLNETALKFLGMKDPIGKRLVLAGRTPDENQFFTIIGVVKDFHYQSLHEKIRPLVIFCQPHEHPFVNVRIRPQNVSKTIAFIKSEWKKFVPDKPFEFFFLNEEFSKLYKAEQRTGEIFTVFSVLAIFIASLGLFGLAAFTAERRSKEIGIRKTLGASVPGIVYLLSKEFTRWVLLANVIAWPVAYFIMSKWLEDFAYRIEMGWWMFLFSGSIALVIALVTVSFHAIKTAMLNPVKSLRYE